MQRLQQLAIGAGSVVLVLAGGMLVLAYLDGAVFERVGEADQSLLFWYLPVLLIGAASLLAGIGMGVVYFAKRGKTPAANDVRDGGTGQQAGS